MPKVLVNAYGVTCEKCDKKVPATYYYGIGGLKDESWIECIHTGWYCPNHSPTSNCDDMDCVCCNLNYEDEEEEGKEWCEVGEHYVDADDMWEDFADCKNCVSEKEYKERITADEEE